MFHLDTLSTPVAATLVLLLGRKLVQTVPFLKKYTIPEPVAGGLLVALALLEAGVGPQETVSCGGAIRLSRGCGRGWMPRGWRRWRRC